MSAGPPGSRNITEDSEVKCQWLAQKDVGLDGCRDESLAQVVVTVVGAQLHEMRGRAVGHFGKFVYNGTKAGVADGAGTPDEGDRQLQSTCTRSLCVFKMMSAHVAAGCLVDDTCCSDSVNILTVYRACVPLVASCTTSCLLMHSQPSRLFVSRHSDCCNT